MNEFLNQSKKYTASMPLYECECFRPLTWKRIVPSIKVSTSVCKRVGFQFIYPENDFQIPDQIFQLSKWTLKFIIELVFYVSWSLFARFLLYKVSMFLPKADHICFASKFPWIHLNLIQNPSYILCWLSLFKFIHYHVPVYKTTWAEF